MRIVAGRWRGRTLAAPRGRTVRPTADRVREALFSILAGKVVGARVLDLFAGTGALGLEALSRGAVSVVFVESDPGARSVLARNIRALAAGGTEILGADARRALARLSAAGRTFDLVFLDPPYGKGLAASAAEGLARGGLLAPGAVVVVEQAAREAPEAAADGWETLADRRYGDTRITLYAVPGDLPGGARDKESG